MSLQTRILFFCLLIALILTGTFSWFYYENLEPTVLTLAEQRAVERSIMSQVFFEQEKNALTQLTQVIGLTFSERRNRDETESESLIKNLKSIDADWIYLLSEKNYPLFSMLVNPLFSKSSVRDLVLQLQKDYPLLFNKISTDPQTLLVLTSEGPALLSVMRIPFNLSANEDKVFLLVCRFIDNALQAKLEKLLPSSKIYPLAQAPLLGEQSQLLATFSDYADGHIITKLDNQKWRSFTALKDVSGKPQILLETIRLRTDGVVFNTYLLMTASALGLLVLLLVGLNVLLNKHLYRPLHQIMAQLSIWIEKTKIKGDLEAQGSHDLEPLTQLINQVIKVINYHQSTALSHAFNEGLNQMRDSFIREIKRLTKPLIVNLTELESGLNDAALNNLESTLTDMLNQISNLDVRASFLRELQHRCNQIRLLQKGYQAKINDTRNKCLHLSTLLQAHTLNYDRSQPEENKAKTQGA